MLEADVELTLSQRKGAEVFHVTLNCAQAGACRTIWAIRPDARLLEAIAIAIHSAILQVTAP
jgi:hypothetical protein